PKYSERGQFIISGSFDYEKRDRVISAIWDEIEKVKRHGVSAEEVEWAKNYVVKSLKRGAETVDDQANTLLYSFLTTGKPFYLDFYLQRISRVTPGDVRRVAEKYLVPEHMILAIVKPYGATCPGDSLTAAHAGGGAPKFEVFTLDNGVRLVLAENDAVQTEDLAVYTLGGQIFEPAEKAGLARFTANYLREGTKKYPDFMALQGILDRLNVRLDVDGGTHTIYMTANFVPSDLNATAEILEQLFMHPTFPRRAEQKLRERQIARIRQAHSSWASDAFMFFNEKFYGDHPYARPVAGYEETVAKLTAKDAKEYWRSVLNPQNIVVAASGPVPVDVMKERLSKIFGRIKDGGQLPEIPEPAPHQKDEYYEKEVNRDQVTLIVGYDACGTRNEQDRWALVAAARLLSGTGGLSGWLPVELRGKRDLVYIAWAGYAGRPYGGHFYLAAQCQPENADTVKAIMLRLVEKLKSGDFTDEELKRITDATAEQMMFSKQRQSDIVSEKGLDLLYGFGVDYSDSIPDKIRAVKKDDVVRGANKYFVHPVIVVMKPASK
ncbi:insulinase family protein, partial [bacterium]|nr:insulinase family protein [bacterium]